MCLYLKTFCFLCTISIWIFISFWGEMEKINDLSDNLPVLDLRDWWEKCSIDDVELLINSKKKWKFWWYNQDNDWITTLNNWKIEHHLCSDFQVLLPEEQGLDEIKNESQDEVCKTLLLSPSCKARDSKDAYERAKYSDKTVFWFESKWKNKAIIVLDFTYWKKPRISRYPLKDYKIKMKTVSI